jgi:hypothetical protein
MYVLEVTSEATLENKMIPRVRALGRGRLGSSVTVYLVSLPTTALLVLYPTCDFSYSFCLWSLPSNSSRKGERKKKDTTCLSPRLSIRICPSPVFTTTVHVTVFCDPWYAYFLLYITSDFDRPSPFFTRLLTCFGFQFQNETRCSIGRSSPPR